MENVSHITSESVSPAGPSEVRWADKAGLSGHNQSQMWSGPRHGGPTTSALSGVGGEERVVGEGPQLVDLWPRAGKNHEPMLTAAMDAAGDLLSCLALSYGLRVLYRSSKALGAFILCFKVFTALLLSDIYSLLFKFLFCSFTHLYEEIIAPYDNFYCTNLWSEKISATVRNRAKLSLQQVNRLTLSSQSLLTQSQELQHNDGQLWCWNMPKAISRSLGKWLFPRLLGERERERGREKRGGGIDVIHLSNRKKYDHCWGFFFNLHGMWKLRNVNSEQTTEHFRHWHFYWDATFELSDSVSSSKTLKLQQFKLLKYDSLHLFWCAY